MPIHPGDPLSPGWASEPGGRKLARDASATVLKIPVLPISYGDALPLLKALKGPVVPPEWRGALPVTYHAGPGPATVRVKLAFDWQSRPLHNVIVRIEGSTFPDEWIVFGNHHDAWVNGADDPTSGGGRADGNRARVGGAVEDRVAPEADDRPRALGRRRVGAARLDGVGREARRRAQGQGRRLHQLGQHRQGLAECRRFARAAAADERSGARRDGSANGEAGVRRVAPAPGAEHARERARGAREGRRPAARRRSGRGRTTRRSCST